MALLFSRSTGSKRCSSCCKPPHVLNSIALSHPHFAWLRVLSAAPSRPTKRTMMSRNIDYYFSMHSPWAYIGHVPFMAIAHRHDVKVTYKPISLSDVFAETGGLPVTKRHPARLSYRILELQRWRDTRGLSFNLHPKFWPFAAEASDRFVVAVAAAGHDPDPFLRRAFAALWEEDQ